MELNRDKGEEFVRETQTPESAAAWKKQLDEFAPGARARPHRWPGSPHRATEG